MPGWPYSFVAALERGRTSWVALLDAVRLGPADDATAVTAAQLRDVVERLIATGHWKETESDILIVMDSGYDVTRLAYVLADLPVGDGGAAALGPRDAAARARRAHRARAPPPPRRRARLRRPGDLAHPGRHQHGDLPLREGRGGGDGTGCTPG